MAASTEKVPLPCSGTHTCVAPPCTISTRSRQMVPVIALKDASQEPQSRSIACLVASEVVSGSGGEQDGVVAENHVCLQACVRRSSHICRK